MKEKPWHPVFPSPHEELEVIPRRPPQPLEREARRKELLSERKEALRNLIQKYAFVYERIHDSRTAHEQERLLGSNTAKLYLKGCSLLPQLETLGIAFPAAKHDQLRKDLYEVLGRSRRDDPERVVDNLLAGWENEANSSFLFWGLTTEQYSARAGVSPPADLSLYLSHPQEDLAGTDFFVDFTKDVSPRFAHLRGKVLAVSAKSVGRIEGARALDRPLFPVASPKDRENLAKAVRGTDIPSAMKGFREYAGEFSEGRTSGVRALAEKHTNVVPALMMLHPDMGIHHTALSWDAVALLDRALQDIRA